MLVTVLASCTLGGSVPIGTRRAMNSSMPSSRPSFMSGMRKDDGETEVGGRRVIVKADGMALKSLPTKYEY